MQKKLLLFATGLFLSQAVIATENVTFKDAPATTPFTGLYGSMSFGYMLESVKVEQTSTVTFPFLIADDAPPVIISSSETTNSRVIDNSATGGIAIGYAMAFKNAFIVGLEARANIESLTAKYETHEHSLEDVPLSGQLNAESEIKLKNDYSLLFKIGYLLQPKTLIYGLIGPSWGYFNLYSTTNATFNFPTGATTFIPLSGSVPATDDGYESGWLAGVGIEFIFSKKASIGLEYTHADYGDLDFPQQTNGTLHPFGVLSTPFVLPTSLANHAEFSAQTNNILLKLNYYLG